MQLTRKFIAFTALAATLSSAALAAPTDPNINVSVRALPASVTLTRTVSATTLPLAAYAAYEVTVSNQAANSLNRSFFNATTSVAGAVATAAIDGVVAVMPATSPCTIVSLTQLTCNLGQLVPGASANFIVVVKSPTAGSRLDLNWISGGDEGNSSTGNGCCNTTGVASTTLVDALSDNATVKTSVRSFIKATGGTFFTGATNIASLADPWTSTVVVPGAYNLPYTTAELVESVNPASCAPDLLVCLFTSLRMPGQFAALEITLRRDASTIKRGAKIDNAVLFYQTEVFNTTTQQWDAVGTPTQILACDALGNVPSGQTRCILSRLAYSKKFVADNNLPVEFELDWEFVLRALENGRTSW